MSNATTINYRGFNIVTSRCTMVYSNSNNNPLCIAYDVEDAKQWIDSFIES